MRTVFTVGERDGERRVFSAAAKRVSQFRYVDVSAVALATLSWYDACTLSRNVNKAPGSVSSVNLRALTVLCITLRRQHLSNACFRALLHPPHHLCRWKADSGKVNRYSARACAGAPGLKASNPRHICGGALAMRENYVNGSCG